MSKKKDVTINNNINIKLDGEKSKKKKRKRKGKKNKNSRPYSQLPQYPSGPIIQTAPAYQQPQIIRPELDYNKFAKNYLAIKDKEEEPIRKDKLVIKDKSPPKKKTPARKSLTVESTTVKKGFIPKAYKPKLKQATILDYENLMNKKKHKTIKALKELMIAHGAPEDQLKQFTKENQREAAVKLFLSKLEPVREKPKTKESVDTLYENKKVFTTSSEVKPPVNFVNPLKRQPPKEPIQQFQDQTATAGEDYPFGGYELPAFSLSPTYQPKVVNSQFEDMGAFSPAGGGGSRGALLSSIEQQEDADLYDPYSTFLGSKDDDVRSSIRTPVRTSKETPLKEKTFTKYVRATTPTRPTFKPASAPATIPQVVPSTVRESLLTIRSGKANSQPKTNPVMPSIPISNISPRPRGRPKKESNEL